METKHWFSRAVRVSRKRSNTAQIAERVAKRYPMLVLTEGLKAPNSCSHQDIIMLCIH